jgi:hypothetical protein
MPLQDFIQYQTISADPIVVGDTRVTPQAQTLTIRFPFGGMVWNRPAAVLIERDDLTQRIPIVDVTRVVQIVLFSLIFSFSVIITLLAARRARPRS